MQLVSRTSVIWIAKYAKLLHSGIRSTNEITIGNAAFILRHNSLQGYVQYCWKAHSDLKSVPRFCCRTVLDTLSLGRSSLDYLRQQNFVMDGS